MTKLEIKESKAIDFIRAIYKSTSDVAIAYSGGKDSQVLRHLAIKAKVKVPLVYSSTTIDPPGTIAWCKLNGARILRPEKTFFQLIEKKGLPSFSRRFCCMFLKERYIAKSLIVGVRADESVKRARIYKEKDYCRYYGKGQYSCIYMPILDFDAKEIETYIKEEQIKCHPLYYDESGKFCVEKRLGCMGCPLPYDRCIKDFEQYPKLVKCWARYLAIYRNEHKNTSISLYNDEYAQLVSHLFFHNTFKFLQVQESWYKFDAREYLQDRFNILLPPPQSIVDKESKELHLSIFYCHSRKQKI